MAYADPQLVTIGADPQYTLPRVSTGPGQQSVYQTADGNVVLSVTHQNGKRHRRTIRLKFSKVAPDPLINDRSIKFDATVYTVLDHPTTGFTVAELQALLAALSVEITDNSAKFVGGEN